MKTRALLQGPDRIRRIVAYLAIRVIGLAVLGYAAVLFGAGAINALTSQETMRGTYGPYPGQAAIGAIAVLVLIALSYRLLMSKTVSAAVGWLVGGVLASAIMVLVFTFARPAPTP